MSETGENHGTTKPQTDFGPLPLLDQFSESATADIFAFAPFEQMPSWGLRWGA